MSPNNAAGFVLSYSSTMGDFQTDQTFIDFNSRFTLQWRHLVERLSNKFESNFAEIASRSHIFPLKSAFYI